MRNWMKRIFAGLLAAVCVLSASACMIVGGSSSDSSGSESAGGVPAELTDKNTGLVYKATADGTALEVSGYIGTAAEVFIPDTYEGFDVVAVYNRAFYQNTTITQVSLGDNVVEIKDRAFFQCTSLTSIFWGEGIQIIGASAFANCSSLTTKFPEGLLELRTSAFANCVKLPPIVHVSRQSQKTYSVIYIPTTVDVIQMGVFSGIKDKTEYTCVLWYPKRGAHWDGDFHCGIRVHPYANLDYLA